MLASRGTPIKTSTVRDLAIPSAFGAANDRACLARGLLSPGVECPGNLPTSWYKMQPGEGMGERHLVLSGAMVRKSFHLLGA